MGTGLFGYHVHVDSFGVSMQSRSKVLAQKMSAFDSASDHSATVVGNETIREALSELLAEMATFKALVCKTSTQQLVAGRRHWSVFQSRFA